MHSRGRPRLLDIGDTNYLASILDANPGLYLDELQARLLDARDVDASIATLSRATQNLAVTKKKVASVALERNELLRATWEATYGDIPMEYFVWLDEASVDN
ncbi:hypothetical protein C8R44DRAFT_649263 [Mycena epipterygia]|nr:hypothetical protein C8R44DRAFT_649263 [Mycena epipterygia]